jgi:hypothetical protein
MGVALEDFWRLSADAGKTQSSGMEISKIITGVVADELTHAFTPDRMKELTRLIVHAMWHADRQRLTPKQFRQYVINSLEAALKPEERFVIDRITKDEDEWMKMMEFMHPSHVRRGLFEHAVRMTGLTEDFTELVEQGRMMDDLFELFDASFDDDLIAAGIDHMGADSLVMQVLSELRKVMARNPEALRELNRQKFNQIIEDLRTVIRNPPRRANGMIDRRVRVGQIYQVINRYAPEGRRIPIPRYVQNQLDTLDKSITGYGITDELNPLSPLADNIDPLKEAATSAEDAAKKTSEGYNRINRIIPKLNKFLDVLPFGMQRFFNQAANILVDENGLARQFGFFAYNARRVMETADGKMTPQPWTVLEWGNHTLAGFLSYSLLRIRNGYVRYAMEIDGSEALSASTALAERLRVPAERTKIQRQFYKKVVKQMRTRKFDDASTVVNDEAKKLIAVFDSVVELGKKFKVPGFEHLEANYFPRLWDMNKIRKIAGTTGGREAMITLVKRAFATIERDGKKVRQFKNADGTIEVFDDIDSAAVVFVNKLIDTANKADNAPMTALDEDLVKAISELEGPVGDLPKNIRSNRLKGRVMMDEVAEVDVGQDLVGRGDNLLSIADLTEEDLPRVMQKYLTSVIGAINKKRMFDALNRQLIANKIYAPWSKGDKEGKFAQVETLEEYIALANSLGPRVSASAERSIRTLMAAMEYEPVQRSNRELFWANAIEGVANIVMPLTYMAKGGGFGLSATAELSRLTATFGIETVLTQSPILKEMVRNYKNMDEGGDNFMMLVAQAFHPATDRINRTLYQSLGVHGDTTGNTFSRENVVSRGLNRMSAIYSDVTGLAPITSFSQNLAGICTIQHLYEFGSGWTKAIPNAKLATLGITEDQYKKLAKWVVENAELTKIGNSRRVVNLKQLGGPHFEMLQSVVDRVVRTTIQDVPTRGDFADIAFSFFGKMLTQFRTFNLKGIDNFMYQNMTRLRHGDIGDKAQVAKEATFAGMFGGLILYARAYMDWKSATETGDKKRAKEIEERSLGVVGFTRLGIQSMSEMMLPAMLVDGFTTAFITDDPILSPYSYSGMGLYGMPAVSFLASGASVAKDVYGATVATSLGFEDKTRSITASTVRHARLILPFQNAPGWKTFMDYTEAEIVNRYRLPERQPR